MKRIIILKSIVSVVVLLFSCSIFSQDLIITTDEKKIDAKILEVSKKEIKYKEKDNLDGPTFVLETSEICSIIYANGKVVLYNQARSQESDNGQSTAIQAETENQEETDNLAGMLDEEQKALLEYLDGLPKNIVALKGDYSMLFNRKCKVYFDFKYDNAQLVTFSVDGVGYETYGDYTQHLQDENLAVDKDYIIQSACDMFNKKMINKKCTFLPISEHNTPLSSAPDDYVMLLQIKRIDVGNGFVSVMSSGRTSAGGAVVFGTIEIKQAVTDSLCSVLIVDRVQGIGAPNEMVRLRHAIEEIVSNKMFFIKKY